MRVQRARQLIDETTLPMTDIAARAGFASIRSFNASFREVYRCTPSELRGRAQQSPPPRDGEPLYEIGSRPDTQSKLL